MSTHARIRMILPFGEKSKAIYVHWDGYPDHMLPLLNTYYNTVEKAEELLSLGDLSYLDKKVKPDADETHSFNRPAKDVTIAYHRDRGEDLCFSSTPQEYNYIFDGETWKLEYYDSNN